MWYKSVWLMVGALFLCAGASSQSARVRVTADGEPLPGAPVYINETYYAAADNLGTLSIPAGRLSASDTLSSSLPGLRAAAEAYDPSRKEYLLALTSDIQIPEVVVAGKSKFKPKRFFKKYVKLRRTYFDFAVYHYEFSLSEAGGKPVTGEFVYSELPDYYCRFTGENGIQTIADLFGERVPKPEYDPLLAAVHRAAVMAIPTYEDATDGDLIVTEDTGTTEGGRRKFSFAVPTGAAPEGRYLRSSVEADDSTGEIVASVCTIRDTAGVEISARSSYAYDKIFDLLHPSQITGSFRQVAASGDTASFDVRLSSLRVKRYPRTMPHVAPKEKQFMVMNLKPKESKYRTMMRRWAAANPEKVNGR